MGRADLVEILLQHGADPDKPFYIGSHLHELPGLFDAAGEGKLEVVEVLLKYGTSVNKVFAGVTALHYAAWGNQVAAAELLLRRGADLHASSGGRGTPLDCAIHAGYAETAEFLLKAGAVLDSPDRKLLTAVKAGHKNMVRLLLNWGASPTGERLDDGWSPLHAAAWEDKVDIARLLLECGADAQRPNKGGTTPLDVARSKAMRELLGGRGAQTERGG